jgi:pimeloyl-ACP methyl ester carboxylesterase
MQQIAKLSVVLTTLIGAAGCAERQEPIMTTETVPAPTRSGRLPINGVNYYYEVHGQGEPLLILHGGLGSIDMFGPAVMLPLLAHRQVIAVDLHGHGHTDLGTRAINLIDIGNDLDALLGKLEIPQADVMGYSFGGGAALRLAIQHPARVRRLVVVSAGFSRDGYYAEMLPQQAQVGAAMADMMKNTPMYTSYVKVAPHPEEFPKLLDRMGELMRTPYNWADEVKQLAMPVMLVFGDSDMFRLEHVVEFYRLLGGGQKDAGWQRENMSKNRLAILPNVTHYEMFMTPAMVTTALPFLDGNTSAPAWR